MKTLVSSIMILGLITAAPAFAEKPTWASKDQASAEHAQAQGEMQKERMQHQVQAGQGEMQKKQMQKKAQGGQGEMHQEQHRELEKKQMGIETGKGSGGEKGPGEKPKKQWWKFW